MRSAGRALALPLLVLAPGACGRIGFEGPVEQTLSARGGVASGGSGAISDAGQGMASGGTANGGAASGGTANGGTANGGAASGGTANGGTANGGTANGGTANGGTANGGTANGGTANGGTANGGSVADSGVPGDGGIGDSGNGGSGSGGMVVDAGASGGRGSGGTKPDAGPMVINEYRKSIEIPAARVAGDLVDFPLLVSLVDSDIAARALADGSDIRFAAADGASVLEHEIEAYGAALGELVAWVRVPVLSAATPNRLFIYYGSGAPAAQAPTSVWRAGFRGVWHLAENPEPGNPGGIRDASAFGANGQALGAMTSGDLVEANIGLGLELDGVDDHIAIDVDPSDVPNGMTYTLSAWMRATRASSGRRSVLDFAHRIDTTYSGIGWGISGRRAFVAHSDGLDFTSADSAQSVEDGQWHHLVGVRNGDEWDLWLDGSLAATQSAPAVGPAVFTDLWLGGNPILGGIQFAPIVLDEARIAVEARTAAWIRAEFDNQSDPQAFVNLGAEEPQ